MGDIEHYIITEPMKHGENSDKFIPGVDFGTILILAFWHKY